MYTFEIGSILIRAVKFMRFNGQYLHMWFLNSHKIDDPTKHIGQCLWWIDIKRMNKTLSWRTHQND